MERGWGFALFDGVRDVRDMYFLPYKRREDDILLQAGVDGA